MLPLKPIGHEQLFGAKIQDFIRSSFDTSTVRDTDASSLIDTGWRTYSCYVKTKQRILIDCK